MKYSALISYKRGTLQYQIQSDFNSFEDLKREIENFPQINGIVEWAYLIEVSTGKIDFAYNKKYGF